VDHRGIVNIVLASRSCRSGHPGGERVRRGCRVDGPEEVVMDAHGKEDRTADEKDS
jgi:hypothetical protein